MTITLLYVLLVGVVVGWLLRSYVGMRPQPQATPAKQPKPVKTVRHGSTCSRHGCFHGRDPRCAAGQCPHHCVLACPYDCRSGTDAEARAIALLSRYGPLEKEKADGQG